MESMLLPDTILVVLDFLDGVGGIKLAMCSSYLRNIVLNSELSWERKVYNDYFANSNYEHDASEGLLRDTHSRLTKKCLFPGAEQSDPPRLEEMNSYYAVWLAWRKFSLHLYPPVAQAHSAAVLVDAPLYLRTATYWTTIKNYFIALDLDQPPLNGPIKIANNTSGLKHTGYNELLALYHFHNGQCLKTMERRIPLFGTCHVYGVDYDSYLFPGPSKYKDYESLPFILFHGPGFRHVDQGMGDHVVLNSGAVSLYPSHTATKFLLRKQRDIPETRGRWHFLASQSVCQRMEDFASALRENVFVANLPRMIRNKPRTLSRFPSAPPYQSRVVSHGVEVCGSSRIIEVDGGSGTRCAYRISIELLGRGHPDYVPPEVRGFQRAQLVSRFWRIVYPDGNVEEVQGHGVIGLFIILDEDEEGNITTATNSQLAMEGIPDCQGTPGVFGYCSQVVYNVRFVDILKPSYIEGYFVFRTHNNSEIQVQVGRFPIFHSL